ncbi:MAG: hypothetical protein AB2693_29395 [Candidatus Thiodiazotropha sp.]
MRRTNCEKVYIPEETILEQGMAAFRKLMCRVTRDSPPRSPTINHQQTQYLVEPISEDELDYEDNFFTPSTDLQLGLIPISDLN